MAKGSADRAGAAQSLADRLVRGDRDAPGHGRPLRRARERWALAGPCGVWQHQRAGVGSAHVPPDGPSPRVVSRLGVLGGGRFTYAVGIDATGSVSRASARRRPTTRTDARYLPTSA